MDHSAKFATGIAGIATAITTAALCRVWLIAPGDLCASCAQAPECRDRRSCLHLAASVGASTRLDGPWRRFPLGAREVGRVARTLEPHLLTGEDLTRAGLAEPRWLALHRIRAFAVWPLADGDRCLGVLAFFSAREPGSAERQALDALGRLAGAALPARKVVPFEAPGAAAEPDLSTMADVQRRAILATLARTGGRVSGRGGAAELLGMKPTTLESRMRRLGVSKPSRLAMRS